MATQGEARELVRNLRVCLEAMKPLNVALPSQQQQAMNALKNPNNGPTPSLCTVGLMLKGCVVEDTMPGSPSFLGGQIKSGEIITAVDGQEVNEENIVELIRGSDQPGSKLTMTLKCQDHSSKTVEVLRQPRAQVLERRDLFIMLDELRAGAGSQVIEQRGKKKPEENLLRVLNKTVDDVTKTLERVTGFESSHQNKEKDLREFCARVNALTMQYLGRIESALQSEDEVPSSGAGWGVTGGGVTIKSGSIKFATDEKPQGSNNGAKVYQLESRLAEAEAALQVQQQAHARAMLKMQAEVESLQDQLSFARAQGEDTVPAQPDDVTISGQLSRAKTKIAKIEAELAVAKSSVESKNKAIHEARMEAQNAIAASKKDQEALKVAREVMEKQEQQLKQHRKADVAARVPADAGVARSAEVASLQAQVVELQKELDGERGKLKTAEQTASQAREEARILLRKRQADRSALEQVEADVMAVTGPLVEPQKAENGNVDGPNAQSEEKESDQPVDGVQKEESNADKVKYEAAIIKIGSLQQKVAELQTVIKSYQNQGKSGVLEMQTAARSATEAKELLESEKLKRDQERTHLTGEIETLKQQYEKKIATLDSARAKLQDLLSKKDAQLNKITDEAQKASTNMKEELQNQAARHEAAWQRTADAVDNFGREANEAKAERDQAVKSMGQQKATIEALQTEVKNLKEALEVEMKNASEATAKAEANARTAVEEAEKREKEEVQRIQTETNLKVQGLQEQLRSAHDNVADSYSMISQAQAKCLSEVEAARAKESAAKKAAKEADAKFQAEIKKLQRHLAGVTGVKDTEIERLNTRIATLEMTIKTRNQEAVSLQLENERLSQIEEQEKQRRNVLEEELFQAKKKLKNSDELISRANENAREAVEKGLERERQVMQAMQEEFKEEGLLEVKLQEAREEAAALRVSNEDLKRQLAQAPGTLLETEAEALRGQVETLERDLQTARSQLKEVREAEAKRAEKVKEATGNSSGQLAQDLSDLLSLRLENSSLKGRISELEEEVQTAQTSAEEVGVEHDNHLATMHKKELDRESEHKREIEEVREEVNRLQGELSEKVQVLSETEKALEGANAEIRSLKGKLETLEEELKLQKTGRKEDVDELERKIEAQKLEAEAKFKDLQDGLEEWKGTAERGDFGTVKRLEAELMELRQAAEEEINRLTSKVEELEAARREETGLLESQLMEKETELSTTTNQGKQRLEAIESKAREKESTIRRLQKEIATYQTGLTDATSEVESLRSQVSELQRKAGTAEIEIAKAIGGAEAAKEEALQDLAKETNGSTSKGSKVKPNGSDKKKAGWLGFGK